MDLLAGALLTGVLAAGVAVPVTAAAGDGAGQPGERRTFAATIEAGWQGTLAVWESFVEKVPNGPGKVDDVIRSIDGAVDKATTVPNDPGKAGAGPGAKQAGALAPAKLVATLVADHGIPEVAARAYIAAAKTAPCPLDYRTLAAMGGVESGHGTLQGRHLDPVTGVLSGAIVSTAAAAGPMQFIDTTWAAYATDGDGDGLADRNNVWDATVSSARLLCASNVDKDWDDAVGSYNGGAGWRGYAESQAYVPSVRARMEAMPPLAEEGSGSYQWPCDGPVASGFGPRSAPAGSEGPGSSDHQGLDLGCANGSDVRAARSGMVTFAGYLGSYGNVIFVDHGDATTRYGHLSGIVATVNSRVNAGQLIGRVGSTGNSTGPHLHFEVRPGDTPADPKLFLSPAA